MSAFGTARRSLRRLSSLSGSLAGRRSSPIVGSCCRIPIAAPSYSPFWHHQTVDTAPTTTTRWFSAASSSSATKDSDSEGDTDNENETRYFSNLENLSSRTQKALKQQGFDQMTEIQAKTWDAVSSGRDMLGRSLTGSGKTLAFLLPTLERIVRDLNDDKQQQQQQQQSHNNNSHCRMLVISPTRELASQIHKTASDLVQHHKGISTQVLYGGVSKGLDLQRMDHQEPTILIATPGRLLDHLENSWLRDSDRPVADVLANVDILVLDEMDRLLDLGFQRDMERIASYLPQQQRQTLLFSATVPQSVQAEIRHYLQPNHATVDCVQEDDPSTHTVNTVQQSHVVLPPHKLITGVVELIQHIQSTAGKKDCKMIVFFNTTSQTSFFASLFRNKARKNGDRILELHSKINQQTRSNTSERFRQARSGILFTSDVSARGVDYPNVTHVVQVGCATNRETYIHRLGRTARAGKSGEGIVVLRPDEMECGVLDEALGGIDIPFNTELQQVLDIDNDDNTKDLQWITHALEDPDMAKKGEDCYRSLFGFYFQQLKQLGIRRPADQVVDLINAFSDQAGLEERPALSYKVMEQYGVLDHPGLTVRGNTGRDSRFGSGFGRRDNDRRGFEHHHHHKRSDSFGDNRYNPRRSRGHGNFQERGGGGRFQRRGGGGGDHFGSNPWEFDDLFEGAYDSNDQSFGRQRGGGGDRKERGRGKGGRTKVSRRRSNPW